MILFCMLLMSFAVFSSHDVRINESLIRSSSSLYEGEEADLAQAAIRRFQHAGSHDFKDHIDTYVQNILRSQMNTSPSSSGSDNVVNVLRRIKSGDDNHSPDDLQQIVDLVKQAIFTALSDQKNALRQSVSKSQSKCIVLAVSLISSIIVGAGGILATKYSH